MSKIHTVIPIIMGEVGAIEKGRKNAQQGYSFRGIDDAYAAFQPLFAKHGVFVVPTVLKSTREERQTKSGSALIYTTLEVKHTFYADDGSSIDALTVGEAMDSGDKSSNKAMSAAMKYALLEVFCVPTQEDNDTENHSPEPLPKQKPNKPEAFDYEKFRDRMLSNLMAHIEQPALIEFAHKAGILKDGEPLLAWPVEHIPRDKAQMNALIERIKSFFAGVPLDAQPPVQTQPVPVPVPKAR